MLNVSFNTKTPWSSGVALKIINILGGSENTLVVGGAVRNWLNDEPVNDIDFATKLLPKRAMKLLEKDGFNVKAIGIDHGTIAIYKDKKVFEITTLRQDVLTDGRHAKVIFGKDWIEDALRRDFTINALYADEYGTIFDPTGLGYKDLENQVIRFIGVPKKRIMEDYLRVIRYFRFFSKYSHNIDKPSFIACVQNAKFIKSLSADRICREFNKMLLDRYFLKSLSIMLDNNLLQYIYSSDTLSDLSLSKRYINKICNVLFKERNNIKNPFLLFTSIIISFSRFKNNNYELITKEIVKRLNFSKNDQKMMIRIISWIHNLKNITKAEIYKTWFDNEKEAIDYLRIVIAISFTRLNKDLLSLLVNKPPIFLCNGDDAIKLGFKEGKNIGKALTQVKDWWIEKDFKPSYEECLKILDEKLNLMR